MSDLVKHRGQAPVLGDPVQLGEVLARSGYFQDARDEAKAAVKVMTALELGLGPIAGMTGVHIIKGKPSISANLMAALVRRHPDYDYKITTLTDERCAIRFFHRGEPLEPESEFTVDDAKRAKLGGDNWRGYPRNMLFARAMSNGVTFHCPDVTAGAPVYTPDELGAPVDGATGEIIDVPATEVPVEQAAGHSSSSGDAPASPPAELDPVETIDPAWAAGLIDKVRGRQLSLRDLTGLLAGLGDEQVARAHAKGQTLTVQGAETRIALLTPAQARTLEQELDR